MAGSTQRAVRVQRTVERNRSRAPGGGAERCEAADERLAGLVGTIEREIIPRLVLAHRRSEVLQPAPALAAGALGPDQVTEFCALVIRSELDLLLSYVRVLCERGVALERIYLELLAPVARRLGDMWLADECDFTTVTLGLWRLHQLLHELSPSFQVGGEPMPEGKRVLLAATPGEQHTFGLFMVAEFFRRAGWDVVDGPASSACELTAAVGHDWFSVAGFSLSRDSGIAPLTSLIRDVRRASRNRGIGIIVGGVAFVEHPALIARVGADASAADGGQAVSLAEAMLEQRLRRCAE
jgi:methanogenic corrinoid protein MtbC1